MSTQNGSAPETTSSKVQKLEIAMAVGELQDDHKMIWTFIATKLDEADTASIGSISYLIDKILHPEIIWDKIPDLLDLFALAEEYRKRTVAAADEALKWDGLYRQEDAEDFVDGKHVDTEERGLLKKIRKPKNETMRRETYRTVVLNLCMMHIRQLRKSELSYLISLYFPQYFPSSEELAKIREAKSPLWLSDISEAELSMYELMRQKILSFLEQVEDWELKFYPNISDEIRNSEEYQARFMKYFPPFVSLDNIMYVLKHQINKIQADVVKLRESFLGEPL